MDPVQAKSPLAIPAEILATLVEISEEINSSLDIDEVLRKTATLVKRLVDYEIFAVMLLDETTQRLYHRFTIGYGEQASKDWQIPLGQGITGTAAASGRAVRVARAVSARPNAPMKIAEKNRDPSTQPLFLERKGGRMIVEPKLRLSHHARRKRDGKPSILA